jgi:hypothetical protein
MDNLVARLGPAGYFEFYGERYGITKEGKLPPAMWQFPSGGATAADYKPAPRAAFPTYGFSVSRSEGMNIAVPVQGVPVGLNLLNSASADGTITIKDAYTFGLSVKELQQEVNNWADANPTFLSQFQPVQARNTKDRNDQFFLRVVNRVYMTKEMAISLFSNEATAGSGSAGIPQPVDLLNIGNKTTNATENFRAINKIINEGTPPATQPARPAAGGADMGAAPAAGGTVKVTMASSRSVSLSETFDRPLVIGFIAFDLPILAGGKLGAPVATQAQLDRRLTVLKTQDVDYGPDANTPAIRKWLKDEANRKQLGAFLQTKGMTGREIPEVINGDKYRDLRREVVQQFKIEGQ